MYITSYRFIEQINELQALRRPVINELAYFYLTPYFPNLFDPKFSLLWKKWIHSDSRTNDKFSILDTGWEGGLQKEHVCWRGAWYLLKSMHDHGWV